MVNKVNISSSNQYLGWEKTRKLFMSFWHDTSKWIFFIHPQNTKIFASNFSQKRKKWWILKPHYNQYSFLLKKGGGEGKFENQENGSGFFFFLIESRVKMPTSCTNNPKKFILLIFFINFNEFKTINYNFLSIFFNLFFFNEFKTINCQLYWFNLKKSPHPTSNTLNKLTF